ncbi:MAG TPA: SusD/RagB family nutrient-binding outer membrane lipoprotein [Flavobacterium sp.]|jgi:hypothetical protein
MKKYKFYVLSVVVAALGLSSCEDYLDINTNPNDPSADIVSPELSLGGAMNQSYMSFVGSSSIGRTDPNTLGNVFMNSWAPNVVTFGGGFTEVFNLDIDNTFYSRIWENLYLTTLGFSDIQKWPSEDYDNHKAIAKIMKTFYFQYLVDLYGDIPYSEAHDVTNPTPVYDDDQAIYRDLVMQLEQAVALIEGADASDRVVSNEDIMLNGDMDQWVRFANTLKLRLLIRESEVAASQPYIQAEMNEFVASGAEFLTEDVTINPGYSNSSTARQNPFYSAYGFLIDETTTATGNQATAASEHAIDFLTGQLPQTQDVYDPRITRLFEPVAGGNFVGVPQGIEDLPGVDEVSPLGPGLIINSAQDGYIFTASESFLLQAEAISRGYMAGNATALFDMAIESSFARLGNTAAQASAYIAEINAGSRLDYDTNPNKIEAIMLQKYVALMGINGIESWIEYTRTGYPETPLATTATRPARPRRLLYPASEYTANGVNVPAQTVSDVFTTGPFWDN